MKNAIFYLLTVTIWGSTWYAIKFQLGDIHPLVSVAHRFGLAAAILLTWSWVFKLNLRFTRKEHLFMGLQGVFLFGFNYLFFYIAELHIASGLAAVIFSTILIMNVVNGAIFLKSPIRLSVIIGGSLGLVGIVLVFRSDLTNFSTDNTMLVSIGLCFAATFLASIGNIISAHNQKMQLPVLQSNAFGMAYGSILMYALALLSGKTILILPPMIYLGALLYLSLLGSVIAFGLYLSLIGSIGADKAAYSSLLFPIVALSISTIWEGYIWSTSAIIGVGMIITGNLLMLYRKKQSQRPAVQRS